MDSERPTGEVYIHSEEVISYINDNYAGSRRINYGKKTVGSLLKHLARRRLLGDELDLGLPEGLSPTIKTEEGGLIHLSLLEYSLHHQRSIEGLSEKGRSLIESFIKEHLPQAEFTPGLE